MTDERLLEQAASGDETAFAVIYERHRGLVFRFAYRLSQSPIGCGWSIHRGRR
jgi:DNA-directed RNA polymerase specialized sigma24 family protein